MTDREKFEQEWQKVMGTPVSVLERMRVGDKYKPTTHDFLNAAYAIWQAALTSQQPADDSRNEMLSMPDMVTAQDMRETLNILLHEEEAEAAATGFNQCLMECAPIYEAYIRRSRCIDELVKELDGMQESLNAKHRSFVAARNRADLAEKKLSAISSKKPADDGWIEWEGGECPVNSGETLDVRFRDGEVVFGAECRWSWQYNGVDSDIIAYRVVKS